MKGTARDRLVSIGILPNVNVTKLNRDVKQVMTVCSRIISLTNNRTKSSRATIHPKRRERDDKNAVAIVKSVSPRGKQARRNPMQKVLGPIRRIRFTQFTQRHASIRETKGPSFGIIQVKNPPQRCPNSMKFEVSFREETERQQRCARSKAWNFAKRVQAQRERQECILLSRGGIGTPGCVNKRAGRKIVCR